MGGFVQISFGWIGSILVPYFRHIIILVILRLNEGFFFRWEVVALFGSCYSERWSSVFLGLVCFRLSLPHGASCSVYSVLFFCVPVCFFLLFCCFQRLGVVFSLSFGVRPVGFAWFKREKKTFI